MKKDFETSSTNSVPVNSVSVDAINFIMDNVFDWDSHKEHAGLRMSYDDYQTLAKSLRASLESACPHVHGRKVIDGFDAHIGGRIYSLRMKNNLSQEDVASHIGVTSQLIEKFETGADKVYATTLFKLSQYIGEPVTSFFEGYDAAKTPQSSLSTTLQNYIELLHNNWAGELSEIKGLTRSVVQVYLEAEAGNRASLETLGRELKGRINYMETHYADVTHAQELPVHMLSNAMETKEDNARTAVEGKTAFAQQVGDVIKQGKAGETSLARSKFPGLFKLVGR